MSLVVLAAILDMPTIGRVSILPSTGIVNSLDEEASSRSFFGCVWADANDLLAVIVGNPDRERVFVGVIH